MEQTIKTTPKDFFLYLLSSVALYYCAGWLVSLLYDYINYGFGSIDSYLYENSWLPSSMRWAIASLVIVFPVYLWITRMLNKDLEVSPEKKGLWVRRWLMYLTLALASIALVIDLIALVNQFLAGEFAATFFLKVGAVALVAGLVFAYYFYELRRDAGKPAPARGVFRAAAIAISALSIIGGFFIVGSPEDARLRRYDSERVSDLSSVQWRVVSFWQNAGRLPTDIEEMRDELSDDGLWSDPVTKTLYEYRAKSTRSFELCATFDRPSAIQKFEPAPVSGPYDAQQFGNWTHQTGRTCFERSINEQLYPVNKK